MKVHVLNASFLLLSAMTHILFIDRPVGPLKGKCVLKWRKFSLYKTERVIRGFCKGSGSSGAASVNDTERNTAVVSQLQYDLEKHFNFLSHIL